jgi:hypothetical protein
MLLDGRVRFRVDALEGGDVADAILVARTAPLERPEDFAALADDPELAALSAAFRATARALVDRCGAARCSGRPRGAGLGA